MFLYLVSGERKINEIGRTHYHTKSFPLQRYKQHTNKWKKPFGCLQNKNNELSQDHLSKPDRHAHSINK